jgi:hypothetical protein
MHLTAAVPLLDVLGIGPGFEHTAARRIEFARDDDLAIRRELQLHAVLDWCIHDPLLGQRFAR